MADKIFPDGLIYKKPREGAPTFVKGSLSIKVPEFIAFLQKYQSNGGWVNLDLLNSEQKDTLYLTLNTYQPKSETPVKAPISPVERSLPNETIEYPADEINPEDIPF